MNSLEAIQLIALKSVIEEDGDFLMRRIARWFSITFHTPLEAVENLPNEYILTHFFEYSFDQMEKRQRNRILRELTETIEEKTLREKAEKAPKGLTDEEYIAKVQKEMAKKAKKRKEKADKVVAEVKKDGERDLLSPSNVLTEVANALKMSGSSLPPLDRLPDIEMKFDSNLDDMDSLSIPPKK